MSGGYTQPGFLSNTTLVMRLGKPMETFKAAIKAFSIQSNDIVVKSLSISRHLNYTLFLSFDALLWVSYDFLRVLCVFTLLFFS